MHPTSASWDAPSPPPHPPGPPGAATPPAEQATPPADQASPPADQGTPPRGPGPWPPPLPPRHWAGPGAPSWLTAGWWTDRRSWPEPFALRRRADGPVLLAALVAGAAVDGAVRLGITTVAGPLLVLVLAGGLVLTGRVRSATSRLLLAAAVILSLPLALRTTAWVVAPVGAGVALLLTLAASWAADGTPPWATFPALATRLAVAGAHLALGPGLLRHGRVTVPAGGAAPPTPTPAPAGAAAGPTAGAGRAAAVGRGAVLALPVVLVVGWLLAAGDPVFGSLVDLPQLIEHLVLVAVGAWLLLGLARTASARHPAPALPSGPRLGAVEATCLLGALAAVYAAFAAAQVVTLTGGSQHVLTTQGLTYAEYARSGFFQLLAAASITLAVLLGVRSSAQDRPLPRALGLATTALTLVVVVVAVGRLRLYSDAFGLTMLRLASLGTAVWIGTVFVLVAVALATRRESGWLAPAVLACALAGLGLWAAADPAAMVARSQLDRAVSGQRADLAETARLGPDAEPAVLGGLAPLAAVDPVLADDLQRRLCHGDAPEGANRARARAREARGATCPP